MFDLNIQLDSEGSRHLYEQIYEYIKTGIREGRLLKGEKLPSTRSLAEYLSISRSTVDYAYDQLLGEGYIEAKPSRGYFVCSMEGLFDIEEAKRTEGDPEDVKGAEETEKNEAHGNDKGILVDFSPNGVEFAAFPNNIWARIARNTLIYGRKDILLSGDPKGDIDLRKTICRYLHSSRGVSCSYEQVIVGAGNDYLLMLLSLILKSSKGILFESPGYGRAYRIFKNAGFEISFTGGDSCGLDISSARGDFDVIYSMPAHQFPTGVVMPIGRRGELLNWAKEKEGRYIIEDDYDSEFRFRGKPIASLQSLDKNGNVIYLGTFSKALAPAIRVSYMVLPERLLMKFEENAGFYSCTVPRLDQHIIEEFIGGGYFERYLNKMRKLYRGKHTRLLEEMSSFRRKFRIYGEDAGLHILLEAKDGTKDAVLYDMAREVGVKVYPLSGYALKDPRESSTVILGFGGLEISDISKGTELLKKAWL